MTESIEASVRAVPRDPADGILRRCSRCRQVLLDDGSTAGRANWWLCAPCNASLLPDLHRAIWRTPPSSPSSADRAGVATGGASS